MDLVKNLLISSKRKLGLSRFLLELRNSTTNYSEKLPAKWQNDTCLLLGVNEVEL